MRPEIQERSELKLAGRIIPYSAAERDNENPLIFLTAYTKGTPDRRVIRFQNQEDRQGAVFSIFFIRSSMAFS